MPDCPFNPSDSPCDLELDLMILREAERESLEIFYAMREELHFYLNPTQLLEVGSKKYIVPQSKALLEMARDQLMTCHKAIMAVKITSPNDRPLLDIKYLKGYEG